LEKRKVLSRSEELSLPEVFWITVDTQQSSSLEFTIEILEAIILALVALATAWSGFQAAQWNGHQAELYSESNGLNLEAANLTTLNSS
jgi:hypothetical protein